MDIKKVTGVYFSPAGSTKTVVQTAAAELARLFKAECRYISLNTPSDRAQEYQFATDELVVFGCPVYAGKLPNKISPDFARILHGTGTPALALVTYGGRAYDNALAEMC
ncbi:MAG: flavodoxin family protein, partial [Butyricicoccaceae bacterium]